MDRLRNHYSLLSLFKMVFWFIRTKIICHKARIFRFPLTILGKKYIDLGERLTLGRNCRIEAYSLDGSQNKRLIFGKDIQLNDNVHINAMERVEIGNNVLMASYVFISDNSHGCYKGNERDCNPETPPIERNYLISPVIIEDNVWIGEAAIVMMGVKIGRGSVIGAHALVNKDIPPHSIAVGNPAKVIKQYNYDKKRWEKV